jgi:hypothetical protein
MNFNDWKILTENEQATKCQDLNPYEEWDVFKGVEAEFIKQYGDQSGVGKIHCGLGPSMGPYNSILVYPESVASNMRNVSNG